MTAAVHTIADGSCKITIHNPAATGATSATACKIHFKILDVKINKNFELLGTNMTSALCSYNTDRAGIVLTTGTSDQNQAILVPHLSSQSAWNKILWGTENQVEWECAISLPNIDNQKVWAGLKLTNDQLIETDANQAYFKFQTDVTNSELFSDFTKLHFIVTIASTTYISQLPITVAANTIYKLRISINVDKKISIFVNGVQYNITTTTGATGGTSVTTGTTTSAAFSAVDLIPYIGIEAGDNDPESLHVFYQKISRVLFE